MGHTKRVEGTKKGVQNTHMKKGRRGYKKGSTFGMDHTSYYINNQISLHSNIKFPIHLPPRARFSQQ